MINSELVKVLEWVKECFPESYQSFDENDFDRDEDSGDITMQISDIINVSISFNFPYFSKHIGFYLVDSIHHFNPRNHHDFIKVDLLFQNGFDYKENIQTFEEFIKAISEIPE